ncbi:MAG: DUF523 and DUF1722 domain-containing protein [Spirochaetaceae bacterium]|nr:DUF523 and DUF1722 domain-containing protein [Spirochaetaceae bacterium]
MESPRPRVFFSRCLGFEPCRWNGEIINEDLPRRLAALVDVVHDCPEMGIGLGCPRDPVRVIRGADGERELWQPAKGLAHGAAMRRWSEARLAGLEEVDGFLLKSRSPSCGWKDVKIYASARPDAGSAPGAGIFGAAVLAARPGIPVEDEGRLRNFPLRENFLGAIWTLARFRAVERARDMGALVDFHSRHKLYLLLRSQKGMRALGKTVANPERRPLDAVLRDYRSGLEAALAVLPRYTSLINAIQHAFGGFSDSLSPEERALFVNTVEEYRDERIPASVLLRLVKAWALRFGNRYLLEQILFDPYPLELVDITDSGKGREGR